jgi:hypothetical protein
MEIKNAIKAKYLKGLKLGTTVINNSETYSFKVIGIRIVNISSNKNETFIEYFYASTTTKPIYGISEKGIELFLETINN